MTQLMLMIIVGGPRTWKKQDGTAFASFELNASAVRFLSGKGDE